MAYVFQDFLVVIENADGMRQGSLMPDEFRVSRGCTKTRFLVNGIEQWHKGQELQGIEGQSRLETHLEATAVEAPVTDGERLVCRRRATPRRVWSLRREPEYTVRSVKEGPCPY